MLLGYWRVGSEEISTKLTGFVLLFDVVALSLLLYFSGGPMNPFSILFLVHVALASMVLTPKWVWLIATVSTAGYALLFVGFEGYGEHAGHQHHYSFHLYGMLIAYIVAAIIVGYFVTKVRGLLRVRDNELQRLRTIQSNQERLAALTALSASTAHELSTPLATIALAAGELGVIADKSDFPSAYKDDIALIRQEVKRCRSILGNMSIQVGDWQVEHLTCVDEGIIDSFLVESFSEARLERLTTVIDLKHSVCLPQQNFLYVIKLLLTNAFDATEHSKSEVSLSILADNELLHVEVRDCGLGMSPEVLRRAREPFFSTKKSSGNGMGLGLFLVDLFADQWGGTFEIISETGVGTTAAIVLPCLTPESRRSNSV